MKSITSYATNNISCLDQSCELYRGNNTKSKGVNQTTSKVFGLAF